MGGTGLADVVVVSIALIAAAKLLPLAACALVAWKRLRAAQTLLLLAMYALCVGVLARTGWLTLAL